MRWLRKFNKQTAGFIRPLIVVALIALMTILALVVRSWSPDKMLSYTDIVRLPDARAVSHVRVDGERFEVTFSDGRESVGIVGDEQARRSLVDRFVETGATVEYGAQQEPPAEPGAAFPRRPYTCTQLESDIARRSLTWGRRVLYLAVLPHDTCGRDRLS